MKKVATLLAAVLLSIGLAGCSGAVESQVPAANLEDYADMPAAEIWVVLEAVTPL